MKTFDKILSAKGFDAETLIANASKQFLPAFMLQAYSCSTSYLFNSYKNIKGLLGTASTDQSRIDMPWMLEF